MRVGAQILPVVPRGRRYISNLPRRGGGTQILPNTIIIRGKGKGALFLLAPFRRVSK